MSTTSQFDMMIGHRLDTLKRDEDQENSRSRSGTMIDHRLCADHRETSRSRLCGMKTEADLTVVIGPSHRWEQDMTEGEAAVR